MTLYFLKDLLVILTGIGRLAASTWRNREGWHPALMKAFDQLSDPIPAHAYLPASFCKCTSIRHS
jgi:hypothetical protein